MRLDGHVDDPFARFRLWWEDAKGSLASDLDKHAMSLSTVDARGRPSSRVVLLRNVDDRGFTFFTNLESQKGQQALGQRHAALLFWWPGVERQVRVEGEAERVSDADADAYFRNRPREAQLGAWASDQSRPLVSREALLARLEEARARFDGKPVQRPPHWSGLRVVPTAFEFWQEGQFRLHHRERYERAPDGWTRALLNP